MGSIISEMATDQETTASGNCFGMLPILPRTDGRSMVVISPNQQLHIDENDEGEFDDGGGGGKVPTRRSPVKRRSIAAESSNSESTSITPQSLTQLLDEMGVPRDDFFLMDPRSLHDPVGQAIAHGGGHVANWDRPTKRPKPVYPSRAEKTPEDAAADDNDKSGSGGKPGYVSSCNKLKGHDCAGRSKLQEDQCNRALGYPFHLDRNLFIPISDSSDGEDCSTTTANSNEKDRVSLLPLLPTDFSQKQKDKPVGGAMPLPSITLKPRKSTQNHGSPTMPR